uniref:Putative secreted protein n=1 Tax=Anopheles marajoara TaxID=58244 RepID=A0A2M4CEP3_9DIPT
MTPHWGCLVVIEVVCQFIESTNYLPLAIGRAYGMICFDRSDDLADVTCFPDYSFVLQIKGCIGDCFSAGQFI